MTKKTTMKTIKLETSIKLGASLGCVLGYVLATMVACSPDIPSGRDAGSNEQGKHDAGSHDAGTCTSAGARILGAACATCVETSCQTILSSCNAENCTRCLLGCTTCLSACTVSPDSGFLGDSGVPSGSGGDGGTPSCDKIRNANCCSFAAAVNMEAQCQQAVDGKNEAICATLLTQTQNFLGRCQ